MHPLVINKFTSVIHMILCKEMYANFKKPTVILLFLYNKLIYTIYFGAMKCVKLIWQRMLATKIFFVECRARKY